jgi:hypothetical protein
LERVRQGMQSGKDDVTAQFTAINFLCFSPCSRPPLPRPVPPPTSTDIDRLRRARTTTSRPKIATLFGVLRGPSCQARSFDTTGNTARYALKCSRLNIECG